MSRATNWTCKYLPVPQPVLSAPPLGAHLVPGGCSFAVTSALSTSLVELCLVDDRGRETSHPMPHRLGAVWWIVVDGVTPGARYGYRMKGPLQRREKFLVDSSLDS